jgi:FkbM family methyltransferase
MDIWFLIAKSYSKIYGLVKDNFGINIRGFGFILRKVKGDYELFVHGRRLYFDHELSEAYARPLSGEWNEPETHHFISFVLSNLKLHFIEIGANIGEILVDIAANPCCEKAIAFEPNPNAVSVILKNIQLNELTNCSVISKALGSEQSTQKMYFGLHSPTASLLSSDSMAGCGVDVQVSTLDSEIALSDLNGKNLVLLIDVEGYELNVMQGAKDLINTCKPLIVFEYHQETKKVFSLAALGSELGDDYTIYRLREDAMLDKDVENAWNCVAIPRNTEFEMVLQSQICAV